VRRALGSSEQGQERALTGEQAREKVRGSEKENEREREKAKDREKETQIQIESKRQGETKPYYQGWQEQ
jgi:hypothetical protein